jgi:hypothetical protein
MAGKGSDKVIRLDECSEGKLWTIPEFSRFSGLSVWAIRKLMDSGGLSWVSIGPLGNKGRRIPHKEVLRFCAIEPAGPRTI